MKLLEYQLKKLMRIPKEKVGKKPRRRFSKIYQKRKKIITYKIFFIKFGRYPL